MVAGGLPCAAEPAAPRHCARALCASVYIRKMSQCDSVRSNQSAAKCKRVDAPVGPVLQCNKGDEPAVKQGRGASQSNDPALALFTATSKALLRERPQSGCRLASLLAPCLDLKTL